MTYVVIEYPIPVSPSNRRTWEPVEGLGPLLFEATDEEAGEFFRRLGGAPSPYRVVPLEYAVKNRILALDQEQK